MQKEIENLESVQGVNFEIIDSLEDNGLNFFLAFDNSCEVICKSKAFVDFATAGRHLGLSTIHFKHNLFHQNKLGRHVELQNTHIVRCTSPRDVMQASTLSAQLRLGSEPDDWFRDVTSVPGDHLLIDLTPPIDDRMRYCTTTGPNPPEVFISRTG